MADSLKASTDGLKLVDELRQARNWNKTSAVWYDRAFTSKATLSRFWSGKPIHRDSFVTICNAVGANWRVVAENVEQLADNNFLGRDRALQDLNDLVCRGTKILLIHGIGGIGKTHLADQYLQRQFDSYLKFLIPKQTHLLQHESVTSMIRVQLQQFGEETEHDFGILLERLRHKIETQKIGILIDNLDSALDQNGKLLEKYRLYIEILRILATPSAQSTTIITSRDHLQESAVSLKSYYLEGLDQSFWQHYFQENSISTKTSAFKKLYRAYGGNPQIMQILCKVINEKYGGSIEVFWEVGQKNLLIKKEIQDLVSNQLLRLKEHNLEASKLLFDFASKAHFQPVSRKELYDFVLEMSLVQYDEALEVLRDRALIEFSEGQYWLHPYVRAGAISEGDPTKGELAKYLAGSLTQYIDQLEPLPNLEKILQWNLPEYQVNLTIS